MTVNSYIGRVLDNKYELTRVLGEGGMGAVYEANHKLIGRKVAVKLLHAEYAQEDDIVTRFQREAQTAAAIGHDHIVDITDMGVTDTGELFIVMESLQGLDLSDLIKTGEKFSFERACHIMIQVLSALEAAHEKGIIHRDLKPGNIFLITHSGVSDYVKLVDFGISKVRAAEDDLAKGLTRTGELLGTPAYMAPEQARGDIDITPATDVYAAGVILFEMLTGTLPYRADALPMLLMKILTEKHDDPRAFRPDIPTELVQAIDQALEKAPEDRFENAAAMRRVFTPFSPDTAVMTGLATTQFGERASLGELARNNRGTFSSTAGNPNTMPLATTPLDLANTFATKSPKRLVSIIGGILGGALLIAATAVFFVMFVGGPSNSPKHIPLAPAPAIQPAASIPATTTVTPATPVAVTAPSNVQKDKPAKTNDVQRIIFSVLVSPGYAEVTLDGKKMSRGSLKTAVNADDKSHVLSISAPGYSSYEESITFTENISRKISLGRSGKNRGGSRSAPPAASSETLTVTVPTPPQPKTEPESSRTVIITEKPAPAPTPEPEPEKKNPGALRKKTGDRSIDESTPW
jgi:serine/threonine protein kinase